VRAATQHAATAKRDRLLADPRKFLHPDHPHKTRAARVRWVLALDEAARLGRAATWGEWNKIWFGDSEWNEASALRAHSRFRRDLKKIGVTLLSQESDHVDARGDSVRAFVKRWVRLARILDEKIAARREEREPHVDHLTCELDAREIGIDYRARLHNFSLIRAQTGAGYERVRRILAATGPLRAPRAKRRLEELCPEDRIARALALFDVGEAVDGRKGIDLVAHLLGFSRWTASRFLRRHGRATPRRGRPRAASPETRAVAIPTSTPDAPTRSTA
jgi:hypothetical protein